MISRHIKACLILGIWLFVLGGCGISETAVTTPTILPEPAPETSVITEVAPESNEEPNKESEAEQVAIPEILDQLSGLPIGEFFEDSYRQLQLRDPDQLFLDGLAEEYGIPNDRFTDLSDEYLRDTQELEAGILNLLQTYDRNTLSSDQQLSYDIYEYYLADLVRGHEFLYYDYPVNSLSIWGKQNWLVDFMVNQFPIIDAQDADDYLTRLAQTEIWVDQLMEGLELREEAGILPPRYLIRESIDQIEEHIIQTSPGKYFVKGNDLYTSFRDKLNAIEGITSQEKEALLATALQETEASFIPAFLKLKTYLESLESKASNESGIYQYPGGQEYYAYMLRHEGGTDMTPEEIHQLGRAEVIRLQKEMLAAATQIGYPEDMSMTELQQRLVSESRLLQGDAMLSEIESLIDKASLAADDYFDLLPEGDLVIQPEPFGSGIGYYRFPPLDGSGPGVFITNFQMTMPAYLIPSYVYHETVPGHHFQIALARESDLPTFQRALVDNAYAEGWALYAELLAWEIGLYEDDPMGNLGRLDFELSRAARLVVDTGIHALGWTRQQAADYYQEATGRESHPMAMNRYVVLPGQGCGYTIGLFEILKLRQEAVEQLGDDFDIKAFHKLVLGQGSLPLPILEKVVWDWVEDQLSQ